MYFLSKVKMLVVCFLLCLSFAIIFLLNQLKLQHIEIKNVSLIVNDTVSLYLKGYELHKKISNFNVGKSEIKKLIIEIDSYSEEARKVFFKVNLALSSQYEHGMVLLLPVYRDLDNIEKGINELNKLQKNRIMQTSQSYKEELDYVLKKDEIEHRIVSTITILRYNVQYLIDKNVEFWNFYTILLVVVCLISLLFVFFTIFVVNKLYIRPIHELYDDLKKNNYDIIPNTKNKEVLYLYEKVMNFNTEIMNSKDKVFEESKQRYTLMSTFAHEARTLLGVLTGNIEIVKDLDNKNELKIVSRTSKDLTALVNKFLLFSKFKEAQDENDLKDIDIYTLLREKCESYEYLAKSKNEPLVLCAYGTIPRYITSDEIKLRNIIDNLMSNAFKYSDGRGVLVVLSTNEDKVSISIRDYGRGIAREKLEKILHPYEQINKFEDIGSGLGLSIVHELVKQLDYRLHIDSEKGKGSIFKVSLDQQLGSQWMAPRYSLEIDTKITSLTPIWLDVFHADEKQDFKFVDLPNTFGTSGFCDLFFSKYELTPCKGISVEKKIKDFSKLTILVAEDFILNQKLITKTFERFGIHPDFANDGIEAENMVLGFDYDVIFMDIKMPRKDGIQAARSIRNSKGGTVSIYALTAAYDFEDQSSENKELFDGFLGKPIDKDKLIEVLNSTYLSKYN